MDDNDIDLCSALTWSMLKRSASAAVDVTEKSK